MGAKEEFKDALRRVIEEFRDAYPELDRVEIVSAIAEIFKQFIERSLLKTVLLFRASSSLQGRNV